MSQEPIVEPGGSMQDDLDRVRDATQQLHQAISSLLAKRAAATRVDAEDFIRQAKASAELAYSAMRSRYDVAEEQIKKNLEEAGEKQRGAQKEAARSLETSGEECRAFLTSALAEASAAAQKVSEAVAAKRAGLSAKQNSSSQKS